MDENPPTVMILAAERIRTVQCGWALPTMQRCPGQRDPAVLRPNQPRCGKRSTRTRNVGGPLSSTSGQKVHRAKEQEISTIAARSKVLHSPKGTGEKPVRKVFGALFLRRILSATDFSRHDGGRSIGCPRFVRRASGRRKLCSTRRIRARSSARRRRRCGSDRNRCIGTASPGPLGSARDPEASGNRPSRAGGPRENVHQRRYRPLPGSRRADHPLHPHREEPVRVPEKASQRGHDFRRRGITGTPWRLLASG